MLKQVKTAIRRHVSPVFSGRKLDEIKKQDIIKLIDLITDGGKSSCRKPYFSIFEEIFLIGVWREIFSRCPPLYQLKQTPERLVETGVLDV